LKNKEITLEELKDSTEIADLAKGMLKVMYAAEGVGLAVPQVGFQQTIDGVQSYTFSTGKRFDERFPEKD
jgi:peptide deformylase